MAARVCGVDPILNVNPLREKQPSGCFYYRVIIKLSTFNSSLKNLAIIIHSSHGELYSFNLLSRKIAHNAMARSDLSRKTAHGLEPS